MGKNESQITPEPRGGEEVDVFTTDIKIGSQPMAGMLRNQKQSCH